MHSSLLDLYEADLVAARTRFATSPALQTLLKDEVDPRLLELFFIYFNAIGVQMTEPVESWITRAGSRCIEIGLPELGRALQMHARHEAGHHVMMIADAKVLVARRNERLGLDDHAESYLATPATEGVQRYVALHEQTISGDAPFGQLAIEYEIERLSAEFGGPLLKHIKDVLGPEALSGMSFLEEHVAIDVGHTKFNAAELERLLQRKPDSHDALVRSGSEALDAYRGFFSDCFALASQHLAECATDPLRVRAAG